MARSEPHPARAARGPIGIGDQHRACPNGTVGCPGPDSESVRLPCSDCFLEGGEER